MSIFAEAIDDLFADPNLARDGLWRAGGSGAPVPVRVVLRRPDRVVGWGETRLHAPTALADLRMAEVPLLSAGDTIEVAGETWIVQGEPLGDAERLVWTAELRGP